MSQIQYKTITMVAFVMLLLLFNPPVYGAVPDYIILDHSNSNGAITGTAGPLTQKVGYANTDVSITNTKSFWTTIKLPPENSTFTLTPTNIYYSFGLIGPNKTATYKLDFYKESMANLGVDPTLESGAGASIMNIVQILLTGLQADFIMDEMFDLSDWLMEAYQIEALNEAANLFLSRKPVNAAWTLANTVYQKDILSKILQLLQKVGYTGNISNLEDKIQVFGIYSIMKQVGDQAWTYLFENPSGYVYFDAKKSNAGEIDPYIVCNFSATPQNAPVNTPITFDASQSIAYKDTIVSYKWNFGDGTTTETTSPSTTHSYKTTGYYYTGLTIKSAIGKGQTGGQSITIGDVTTGGRYFAGGTLTESTTWAVENSPILIAGSLTIPDGVSLTIQNGVQVILNNGVSISVSGTLKATGVKFTAQDQAGSWWAGITFDGAGSKDSRLENCVLECVPYYYVYGHCGVISVKDSSPTIKGCTIDKCSTYYGILINNGSPVIQGNTINGFKESGIYVDGTSSPAITGNTISNNEYGIYVSYSANNPIFSGNSYSDNAKGDLTVEGTIQGAVSWDETSDAVYNIKRLNIPQGSSLTIASGRTLKINPGISIPVSGTLKATGVKFTAQDQAGSWWAGITFYGAGSKDSRLENCVLECVPYY
ncbi:MAG: right-handed parallel beta-helix repeat-containing protein, partial [Deltaproteobacteria bacterium]